MQNDVELKSDTIPYVRANRGENTLERAKEGECYW